VSSARLRRWLPVAAALLAGVAAGLVLSAGAPRRPAEGEPLRHEDPRIAAEETDPAVLFAWYLTSLSHFQGRRFAEGRRVVVRLGAAHLPADVQVLAREVDALLIKEGSILEAADLWLREGAGLLATGRIEAADPLLAQIDQYARRGMILADDLLEGIEALGRQSRVAALPKGAPERQAYDDLLSALPQIKVLLEQYRTGAADARALALALAAGLIGTGPLTGPPGLAGLAAGLPESLAEQLAYATRITLTAVSPAYPGRAVTVRGTAAEEGPASLRPIILRLDDAPLATFPLGPFRGDVPLPPGTTPGMHTLSATVPAAGPYLAAAAQAPLRVVQALPAVRLQLPAQALAPGRLRVSGRASSRFGPLAAATVEVRVGPVSAAGRASDRGEFALTLRLPAALDLVGAQNVTVRVVPEQPWNAPGEARASVFVINLINVAIAGAVALLAPMAALAYRSSRRRRMARREPEPLPATAWSLPPLRLPEPVVEVPSPATPRDELIATYREAAAAVQRLTGMELAPAMTLREYARLVRPLLRSDAFGQLTTLVEAALYSPRPVTLDQPPQARDFTARVEREVAHVG